MVRPRQEPKGIYITGSQRVLEVICSMGRPYKCPYCRGIHTIWKGYRVRAADRVRLRKCKDCGRKFTTRRTLAPDLKRVKTYEDEQE